MRAQIAVDFSGDPTVIALDTDGTKRKRLVLMKLTQNREHVPPDVRNGNGWRGTSRGFLELRKTEEEKKKGR